MSNTMHRRCVGMIMLSAALTAVTMVATAANYDWDNGGADDKWATGDNWSSTESDNTPPQDDDIAHIGSSSPGISPATVVVDQAGAVANQLKIGYNTGKQGTLIVDGGSVDVKSTIIVSVSGLGRLVLSNGTVKAATSIDVGNQFNKPLGTIEMEGGYMQTASLNLGQRAPGLMIQNGGTNRVTNKAYLGFFSGALGTYELRDGLFNPSIMDIGVSGTGTVLQTGGTLENLGQTTMGVNSNSVGNYHLENGTLSSSMLYIGNYGHGAFTQTGGTNVVNTFLVLPRYNTGVYNMWGGVLLIGTNGAGSAHYVAAGFDGVEGTFNFGTTNSSGVIRQAPGSSGSFFTVRRTEGAKGTVRGWGVCELTGYLQNSGIIIADGYGTERDLDFSAMSSLVANYFVNTTTNGWYARDHGRLLLPAIAAGNPIYWGELNNQDLVNSVKLELTGSGSVTGALLAVDHALVNPGLNKPIGVWEFAGNPGITSGKLTFLYDAAQLAAMNIDESRLRVWRHDGTSWMNVTDTGGLDTGANTIRTATGNPFGQFAVAPIVQGTVIMVQ